MEYKCNENILKEDIKLLRQIVLSESKETKMFLGVTRQNIVEILPLRFDKFNLWTLYDNGKLIGYIKFQICKDAVFLSSLYILENFRNKDYGTRMLNELIIEHKRVCCKINRGNDKMYSLVRKVGLKGVKPVFYDYMKEWNLQPIWWSNYMSSDKYID